jgi:hypothetical protein
MVPRHGSALVTPTVEINGERQEAESAEEPPRPFHLQSYSHLLQFPVIPAGARDASRPVVDAIVVPTVRSPKQLDLAAELALRARCQLVTLYTDDFPADLSSVLGLLQRRGLATPLALRSKGVHYLLDLAAELPQSLRSSCALDISRKRNLGLLIGRACGWERMLFLDDDIRRVNVEKLTSAAVLLAEHPVVGLQVSKYPDASVVGHARRLTGRRQEPFISGGSLLVNPQRLRGFFPPVYHEDWLCIINHLRLGEVAIGGKVGQLAYQPFTTPQRARLEEFGEILASGLLWLVDAGNGTNVLPAGAEEHSVAAQRYYWRAAMTPNFWQETLSQRAALLKSIATRLDLTYRHDTLPLQSVRAAQGRCAELSPQEFVSFVRKWIDNLAVWEARMPDPHRADSVAKAIAELGLWHAVRVQERDRWGVRAAWDYGTSSARRWQARAQRLSARAHPRQLRRTAAPGSRKPAGRRRSATLVSQSTSSAG